MPSKRQPIESISLKDLQDIAKLLRGYADELDKVAAYVAKTPGQAILIKSAPTFRNGLRDTGIGVSRCMDSLPENEKLPPIPFMVPPEQRAPDGKPPTALDGVRQVIEDAKKNNRKQNR